MKPIRLSAHAATYFERRGFNVTEVEDAIRTSEWTDAKSGKLECRKDFPFFLNWNGKMYPTKQVRPIFVDDEFEIVVITVYTYYF